MTERFVHSGFTQDPEADAGIGQGQNVITFCSTPPAWMITSYEEVETVPFEQFQLSHPEALACRQSTWDETS